MGSRQRRLQQVQTAIRQVQNLMSKSPKLKPGAAVAAAAAPEAIQ